MKVGSSKFSRFFLYLFSRFSHDPQVLKNDIYNLLHIALSVGYPNSDYIRENHDSIYLPHNWHRDKE